LGRWFVNCLEFGQVNRSIEAEAVVAQRSEFVLTIVFVNQWAANGEKQYEERYGQF